MLTGNRGEWSEPYVFLKLLADGVLRQAEKDFSPSDANFLRILRVSRSDISATLDSMVRFEKDGKRFLLGIEMKSPRPKLRKKHNNSLRPFQRAMEIRTEVKLDDS